MNSKTVKDNKCHIIAVTESWLQKDEIFFVDSYNCFRCDRLHRAGGGALLLTDSTLSCRQFVFNKNFSYIEVVCIDIFFGTMKSSCCKFFPRRNVQSQGGRGTQAPHRPPGKNHQVYQSEGGVLHYIVFWLLILHSHCVLISVRF